MCHFSRCACCSKSIRWDSITYSENTCITEYLSNMQKERCSSDGEDFSGGLDHKQVLLFLPLNLLHWLFCGLMKTNIKRSIENQAQYIYQRGENRFNRLRRIEFLDKSTLVRRNWNNKFASKNGVFCLRNLGALISK